MAAVSTPLDLESHYRQLLNLLDAPVSGRWVLVQVDRFLDRIDVQRAEAESYLLPLVEPLAETVDELDPVGLSPSRIERLATVLRTAQTHQAALRNLDAAAQAERALRRRAALLYAYAGAVRRALSCLSPDREDELAEETLNGSRPDERFRAARSAVDDPELERELKWIERRWKQQEGDEGHVTCIPVVERRPSWMETDVSTNGPVGALRQVGVELYGPSDTTDRLQVDVVVHGADEVDVTAVPLTAARQLLDERHPRLQGRYVQGRLAFDRRHLEHGGRSAGVAIAALFYGAVLDHTHRRRRLHLRPPVALTGAVMADGTVESIEAEALPTKVRTVFFSPKTTLVVPEAQREVAEETRDALLEDCPNGDLDVVGVDRLDAVFYDRRLTAEKRVGWVRHAAQRLWHRRGQVAAGTVIAALLLVIAALLYGPIDKNPVRAQFEGKRLWLLNDAGRRIESIPVGRSTVRSTKKKTGATHPVAFCDADGDGQNEVFYGTIRAETASSTSTGRVYRTEVGRDEPSWSRKLFFDLTYPKHPGIQSRAFYPQHLFAEDLYGDDTPELLLTARHNTYFPFVVLELDPRTGETEQRYLHPGWLRTEPIAANLQNDGPPELILGGKSNAFDEPILTVLDPARLDGQAPAPPRYRAERMSRAHHVAYVRFPETAVGIANPPRTHVVRSMERQQSGGILRLEISQGPAHPKTDSFPGILIHMDRFLRPLGVGTDDEFDRRAEQLVREGRLDAVPGPADFERYVQRIRYWTGKEWTSAPTMSGQQNAGASSMGSSDSAKTEAIPDSISLR